MNNTGGPAFPGLHPSKECHYQDAGMTLRDYFAAKAMPLVPKQNCYNMKDNEPHETYIARRAYAMADAMLKAREAK